MRAGETAGRVWCERHPAGGRRPGPTRLVRKPGMIAIFHNVPAAEEAPGLGLLHGAAGRARWAGTIPQPRGRVLGGSGSINGMLFVRGNRQNYDDWAAEGCAGLGLRRRAAQLQAPGGLGGRRQRAAAAPAARSRSPRQKDLAPATQAFIEAIAATAGVHMLDDYNGASQEGVGSCQKNARGGLRYSSSVGLPGHHGLPGLDDPDTGVAVARVVIEKGRAVGVEVIDEGGTRPRHPRRARGDPLRRRVRLGADPDALRRRPRRRTCARTASTSSPTCPSARTCTTTCSCP